jgi:hypothetical protein
MRKPKYLSPSALMTYNKDPDEYFLKYLGPRLPRLPQTRPMSVGSAFDAEVKIYISNVFYGAGSSESIRLGSGFEDGVEPHNRDWARVAGSVCFEAYRKSGALSRLMTLLKGAEPVMEASLQGSPFDGDCVLMGKPDLFFYTADGAPVILDWKVNGYCSKASPKAGYQICLDGWGLDMPVGGGFSGSPSRSHNKSHKDYMGGLVGGVEVNIGSFFETVHADWALQCATYSWLCDHTLASCSKVIIVGIDQLACDGTKIRVAQHRGQVSRDFQVIVRSQYEKLWDRIANEHIFDGPIEESRQKQLMLEGGGASLPGLEGLNQSKDTQWMGDLLQSQRTY